MTPAANFHPHRNYKTLKPLYSQIKSSLSNRGILYLYSLLYTLRNSHFEAKFHLTNLDWDRHALFLLQKYYLLDNRGFSKLFEEYSLDLFSPDEEEGGVREQELMEYMERVARMQKQGKQQQSSNDSEAPFETLDGDKLPGTNNGTAAGDSSNQADASSLAPWTAMKEAWDASFKSTTVFRKEQYPVPGKVLLHRLLFIVRQCVQEQSRFPPQGMKAISPHHRSKYYVARMEEISRIWKALHDQHLLLDGETSAEKQDQLQHFHYHFKTLEDFLQDNNQEENSESTPEKKSTSFEESSRKRLRFYPVSSQGALKSFIMDMVNVDSPEKLLQAFVARSQRKHSYIFSEHGIETLSKLKFNSFDELEHTLALLLAGEHNEPLKLHRDGKPFSRGSASMVKAFNRCPWYFNYRYVYRFRFPDSTGVYSGNALHEAQDHYQRIKKESEERGEELKHEEIKERATKTAMDTFHEQSSKASKKMQKRIKKSQERLEEDMQSVFTNESTTQGEHEKLLAEGKIRQLPTIATEYDFNVHFEGLDLVGTMDRVETHYPTDGEDYIVISEFKRTLRSMKPDSHHQLMIYAIAYEIINGAPPHQLALESPKERRVFTITPEWLQKAKQQIKRSMGKVNSRVLIARPSPKVCATCEARVICPTAHHQFFPQLKEDKREIETILESEGEAETEATIKEAERAASGDAHGDGVRSQQPDAATAPPQEDSATETTRPKRRPRRSTRSGAVKNILEKEAASESSSKTIDKKSTEGGDSQDPIVPESGIPVKGNRVVANMTREFLDKDKM